MPGRTVASIHTPASSPLAATTRGAMKLTTNEEQAININGRLGDRIVSTHELSMIDRGPSGTAACSIRDTSGREALAGLLCVLGFITGLGKRLDHEYRGIS